MMMAPTPEKMRPKGPNTPPRAKARRAEPEGLEKMREEKIRRSVRRRKMRKRRQEEGSREECSKMMKAGAECRRGSSKSTTAQRTTRPDAAPAAGAATKAPTGLAPEVTSRSPPPRHDHRKGARGHGGKGFGGGGYKGSEHGSYGGYGNEGFGRHYKGSGQRKGDDQYKGRDYQESGNRKGDDQNKGRDYQETGKRNAKGTKGADDWEEDMVDDEAVDAKIWGNRRPSNQPGWSHGNRNENAKGWKDKSLPKGQGKGDSEEKGSWGGSSRAKAPGQWGNVSGQYPYNREERQARRADWNLARSKGDPDARPHPHGSAEWEHLRGKSISRNVWCCYQLRRGKCDFDNFDKNGRFLNTDCTFLHWPQDRTVADVYKGICDRNRPEVVSKRGCCGQHPDYRALI